MTTPAEGVETRVQSLFLAAQRCEQPQGRHFGEPIPGRRDDRPPAGCRQD